VRKADVQGRSLRQDIAVAAVVEAYEVQGCYAQGRKGSTQEGFAGQAKADSVDGMQIAGYFEDEFRWQTGNVDGTSLQDDCGRLGKAACGLPIFDDMNYLVRLCRAWCQVELL